MTVLGINKKIIFSISVAALLSGCATTKPAMTNNMYDKFAASYLVAERCGNSGKISPEDAVWAKKMLNYRSSSYSYDQNLLNRRYREFKSDTSQPSSSMCNEVAISSVEYRQMVESHNARVDANSRATQNQIQNNRPVNTYCNKIGRQVFCNSF